MAAADDDHVVRRGGPVRSGSLPGGVTSFTPCSALEQLTRDIGTFLRSGGWYIISGPGPHGTTLSGSTVTRIRRSSTVRSGAADQFSRSSIRRPERPSRRGQRRPMTRSTRRSVLPALSFERGTWARMPAPRRAEMLEIAATLIRDEADRLSTLESLDTGKNIHGSSSFDVYEAATAFSYAAATCRTMAGDIRRTSFPPDLYPDGGPRAADRTSTPAGRRRL